MRGVVVGLVLLGLLAVPVDQEVRYTRAGYAACLELGQWRAQERARAYGSDSWYRLAKRQVAEGSCWLTRDSTAVVLEWTRHPEAVPVRRVAMKGDSLWWLAREALR